MGFLSMVYNCLLSSKLFLIYDLLPYSAILLMEAPRKGLSEEQMYRITLSLHIRAVLRTSDF